jgi:hypothetical protein
MLNPDFQNQGFGSHQWYHERENSWKIFQIYDVLEGIGGKVAECLTQNTKIKGLNPANGSRRDKIAENDHTYEVLVGLSGDLQLLIFGEDVVMVFI